MSSDLGWIPVDLRLGQETDIDVGLPDEIFLSFLVSNRAVISRSRTGIMPRFCVFEPLIFAPNTQMCCWSGMCVQPETQFAQQLCAITQINKSFSKLIPYFLAQAFIPFKLHDKWRQINSSEIPNFFFNYLNLLLSPARQFIHLSFILALARTGWVLDMSCLKNGALIAQIPRLQFMKGNLSLMNLVTSNYHKLSSDDPKDRGTITTNPRWIAGVKSCIISLCFRQVCSAFSMSCCAHFRCGQTYFYFQ